MININKAIAGVLLFTMLLSGIPEGLGTVLDVYADDPPGPPGPPSVPDYSYTVKEDGSATIDYYDGSGGDVVIPDALDGHTVTGIGGSAFHGKNLTSVTIPSSVTSIGDSAFYDCNNLASVSVSTPSSLTSIDRCAFLSCRSLTNVTIPEGVTSIGDSAFLSCRSLTNVTIPEGVTSIGDSAFYDCRSLASVTLPTSLESIGNDAFIQCVALGTVYYRGTRWNEFVRNIEYGATVVGNFTVSDISSRDYNGSAYNPVPTVQYGTTTLTKDTHYTLGYQKKSGESTWSDVAAANIKDAGTYRVVVAGVTGTDYADLTAYKEFSINPKAVTITANDASKTYDGSALTAGGFSSTALETGDTHTFSVAMTAGSTITNAGTQANVIATVDSTSVTAGTETVIGNYKVTTANGTLTVNRKAVTITTESEHFTYDGTAHGNGNYDVQGLVGSDALTAVLMAAITTPDESPVANTVSSYQFTTGSADNYSVTTTAGQLTMSNASIPITITAGSARKTYDGSALTDNTVTVTVGSLCTGDRVVANTTGSVTDVADSAADNNTVAAGYKIMHGGSEVTGSYVITTAPGTLTITPKAVTVKARDKAFTYDGNAHICPEYDVTGLCGNDAIDAVVTGSIRSISESPVANVVASYEFRSGTASNYTVTTQNGQLTMTENPIYTITFFANNGTGVTAVQDAEKGTTVSLKPNGFSYAGHTFKEWNDKADGSGKSYKDKESIPVNADMSLYAQWTENERKSYSVMVISLIGGMAKADKTKGTEGESVKLSAKADKGYDFKEWRVEAGGVELSDKKDASATFKIKTADVQVKAYFEKKHKDDDDDDDNDNHDDSPSPSSQNNTKIPDGCDELRESLSSAISAAIASGKAQIVYWSKGTSLPADVMKKLHDNPNVTLVFSYTYQGVPITLTIPGSAVVLNPAVEWYGPAYLYGLYGKGKTAALTTNATASTGTYTIKSGDTLSGIAKRLHTTVKNLQDANNIKDADKIKPGMVLKY